MRKINAIPRIIRINGIRGFKVYCAFNNGEHRIIDFVKLSDKLNFTRDKMRMKIMDPSIFKTVSINNNTLTWEGVRKVIKLASGESFDVAFDLDPLVLYENSEPDVKRNERFKIGELIKSERESAGLHSRNLRLNVGLLGITSQE
jgi:hypothetical protein